jgi:hypothetical protein
MLRGHNELHSRVTKPTTSKSGGERAEMDRPLGLCQTFEQLQLDQRLPLEQSHSSVASLHSERDQRERREERVPDKMVGGKKYPREGTGAEGPPVTI